MSRNSLHAAIVWLAIFALPLGYGQSSGVLSRQAAAVKRQADALAPQALITIVQNHAEDRVGRFVSADADTFTFYDSAETRNITLRYSEVKKIKAGTGSFQPAAKRHGSLKHVIFWGALTGALLAISLAAAAS